MDPADRLESRLLARERRLARPCAPQRTVHRAERALLRRSLRRVRTLQQALRDAVARRASKSEIARIESDLGDAQAVVQAILNRMDLQPASDVATRARAVRESDEVTAPSGRARPLARTPPNRSRHQAGAQSGRTRS